MKVIKEVVLKAIKRFGFTLKLKTVKQSGWALLFTSEELRNDKDMVLKAVENDGKALEYASERL